MLSYRRLSFLACLLALVATTANGAPVRPSPADVSVKNGGPDAYRWYQGHTADQRERDAMELTRIGVTWPEATLLARSVGCYTGGTAALMSRTIYAFFPIYTTHTLVDSRGVWFVGLFGHYYDNEHTALEQVRSCLLVRSAACATSPRLTLGMQIALDLHVAGGRCLPGNPIARLPPTEAYQPAVAVQDIVQSIDPPPALDASQLALLEATMTAHAANTRCRCHLGPCPGGDVAGAHFALEASARPGQAHFLAIPAFSGLTDPGWSAAEECAVARLTDHFHHLWGADVAARDWGRAYVDGLLHLSAHLCLNIGTDPRLLVRFPCGKNIESCPKTTCRQAIGSSP